MKTYNVTYQIYIPSGTKFPISSIQVFAKDSNDAYQKAEAMAMYHIAQPIGGGYAPQFKRISVVEFNACSTLGSSNKNSTY